MVVGEPERPVVRGVPTGAEADDQPAARDRRRRWPPSWRASPGRGSSCTRRAARVRSWSSTRRARRATSRPPTAHAARPAGRRAGGRRARPSRTRPPRPAGPSRSARGTAPPIRLPATALRPSSLCTVVTTRVGYFLHPRPARNTRRHEIPDYRGACRGVRSADHDGGAVVDDEQPAGRRGPDEQVGRRDGAGAAGVDEVLVERHPGDVAVDRHRLVGEDELVPPRPAENPPPRVLDDRPGPQDRPTRDGCTRPDRCVPRPPAWRRCRGARGRRRRPDWRRAPR